MQLPKVIVWNASEVGNIVVLNGMLAGDDQKGGMHTQIPTLDLTRVWNPIFTTSTLVEQAMPGEVGPRQKGLLIWDDLYHERGFWSLRPSFANSIPGPGGALNERRRRRAEKRSSKTRKWTAQFSQLALRFSEQSSRGQRSERTLQKHPFGRPCSRTAPSPLLWRVLNSQVHIPCWRSVVASPVLGPRLSLPELQFK